MENICLPIHPPNIYWVSTICQTLRNWEISAQKTPDNSYSHNAYMVMRYWLAFIQLGWQSADHFSHSVIPNYFRARIWHRLKEKSLLYALPPKSKLQLDVEVINSKMFGRYLEFLQKSQDSFWWNSSSENIRITSKNIANLLVKLTNQYQMENAAIL